MIACASALGAKEGTLWTLSKSATTIIVRHAYLHAGSAEDSAGELLGAHKSRLVSSGH
jgi:hypothetical protein